MTVTYDPATVVGKIRLLLTDIDLSVITGDRANWTVFFDDEEIDIFYGLAIGAGDAKIFRGAALGLRTLAISRALIARIITIGSYSENSNGAAIAKLLNDKAKEYDALADSIEGPYSSYVSYDFTDAGYRARLWREALMDE